MRDILRSALALTATATLAAATTAQAAPMRYTFYDCGAFADCSTETPTVMAQFRTSGVIQAPAVPPAGSISAAAAIAVDEVFAGAWDELGIASFNINGFIGSQFVLFNFEPENGRDFAPVMAFGAAFAEALRLNWTEGTYTGLGYVNCFNIRCTSQTTIRGFAKLTAEIWTGDTGSVPVPGTLGLALAALGLAAGLRRPRAA